MNDIAVVLSVLGFTLSLAAAGWLLRSNLRLVDQLSVASDDKRLLQMACADAREAFRRYAEIHIAKNTPEGDKKANVNTELANEMAQVLNRTGYRELGPMQRAIRDLGRQLVRANQNG